MWRLLKLVLISHLLSSCGNPSVSQVKVVYGDDDRQEILATGAWSEIADAVGAQVFLGELRENSDGTFSYLMAQKFRDTGHFCQDEKFLDQRVVGNGSGFLLSDQETWVTANHVLDKDICGKSAFVLGYNKKNEGQSWWQLSAEEIVFTRDSVYFCKEVIYEKMADGQDIAMAKLDRPVRRDVASGLLAEHTSSLPVPENVTMIGHPKNVVAKLVSSAQVLSLDGDGFLRAELDAYAGNSGSPVFNSETRRVIGVLKGGESDYVKIPAEGNCRRTKICRSGECKGEKVSLIEGALAQVFEVGG